MKTASFYVLLLCWKTISCNYCKLSNVTIVVEREECGFCVSVNATWCSGYCFTKKCKLWSLNAVYPQQRNPNHIYTEDPAYKYHSMKRIQKVCTFKDITYETVKIPGCDGHGESFYSYPVATGCHCETCDTEITDCTMRGLKPSYCSYGQDQIRE